MSFFTNSLSNIRRKQHPSNTNIKVQTEQNVQRDDVCIPIAPSCVAVLLKCDKTKHSMNKKKYKRIGAESAKEMNKRRRKKQKATSTLTHIHKCTQTKSKNEKYDTEIRRNHKSEQETWERWSCSAILKQIIENLYFSTKNFILFHQFPLRFDAMKEKLRFKHSYILPTWENQNITRNVCLWECCAIQMVSFAFDVYVEYKILKAGTHNSNKVATTTTYRKKRNEMKWNKINETK